MDDTQDVGPHGEPVQDATPPPASFPPPPPSSPPPSSPPPANPARLVRDSSNVVVGGVASGIAAYLGIDPVFVRIAFVLLGFAGGVGLVIYLGLYVAMPEGVPAGQPVAYRRDAGWWIALVLFGVAGLMIIDGVRDGGSLLAVVLVGAGVALWRRDGGGQLGHAAMAGAPTQATWPDASAAGDPAAVTPAMAVSGGSWQQGAVLDRPRRVPASEQAPDWTAPPAPDRKRSMLGAGTLAAAFFTVATLVSLNIAGVTDLGVGTVSSIAMIIVGGGLVVGTWLGRARWLVIPAILLLPIVVLGSAAQVEGVDELFGAGFVSNGLVVADITQLEPRYEAFAGDFNLDLTGVDFSGQETDVQIEVAFGTITVNVPDDVTVIVTARARGGQFDAFGDQFIAGSALDETYTSEGQPGGGTLRLDLDMTFGDMNVVRTSSDLSPESVTDADPMTDTDPISDPDSTTVEESS